MTANTSVGQEQRWGARAAALAVGATLAALLGGANASAATVLGAPEFLNAGNQNANNFTMIQTTSPGNNYAAPTDGVITSWGKFAGASPQQLKLKIARLVAGQYQIVGESPLQTLTVPNAKNTFTSRIPVKAGDVIGLYTANNGPVYSDVVGFPYSHQFSWQPGDTPMSGVLTGGPQAGQLVVYATHELDADNDGFGDDSQDKCKGQAGTNNGCPPAKKKKKCKKKKKKKANSAAATAKKKGCKKKK